MSIFSRIFKVGQAAANKVVDKMENPELMLDQAIRDKEKQIAEARKSIQSCIATERQAKALLEKERSEQLQWEQKAEMALRAGKEDLAVKALERSSEHESKVGPLQSQWESQAAAVGELKKELTSMNDQLAEYKRNKDFIIAQSKAAKVKKDIYEAKARISGGRKSADDLMARMKAKAERQSLEADAAKELANDADGVSSLEKEFEALGDTTASSQVNDKLAALKAKMAPAQLPG